MNLRSVDQYVSDSLKRVILRMDLDVPDDDNSRLEKSINTIKYLLQNGGKIAIIGHKGRPEGRDEKYSLKKVYADLMSLIGNDVDSLFLENFDEIKDNQLLFFEDLRFFPEEEKNDNSFLRTLIDNSDAFVNDAFAVAHREHASIMLCNELDTYYGFAFVEEANKILEIIQNPKRPITVILGGAKEDKLKYLSELVNVADNILIGGKLPIITNYELRITNDKVIWGKIREDTLDLSDESINKFIEVINSSNMIVWAGAMGYFEREDCRVGTQKIAEAVAKNGGIKIVAGGDTSASIKNLGISQDIFVCSGGGVMLQLLAKGTLPAIAK